MGKRSMSNRIERLEDICIGAGLLLKKLRAQHGQTVGVGMNEQINECIRDCDHVARNREIREENKAQGVVHHA